MQGYVWLTIHGINQFSSRTTNVDYLQLLISPSVNEANLVHEKVRHFIVSFNKVLCERSGCSEDRWSHVPFKLN